jgi:hypothetical protein
MVLFFSIYFIRRIIIEIIIILFIIIILILVAKTGADSKQGNKAAANSMKSSVKFQEVVVDIKKINAITKTLKKKKVDVGSSLEEKITKSKDMEKSYFEPESPMSEINGQIIEEFIREEEAVNMEADLNDLKEKILEFLKNGTKVTIERKECVIFDDLLLNITKLIKKLIAFECFAPNYFKKQVGSHATPRNKKLKAQIPTNDDFSKVMFHLIHLLEYENKGINREQLQREEKKDKKKFGGFFEKMLDTLREPNKKKEKSGSIFFNRSAERQPSKILGEKPENRKSLNSSHSDMSFASLILRKKFLRYAEVKFNSQEDEREEPVDVISQITGAAREFKLCLSLVRFQLNWKLFRS